MKWAFGSPPGSDGEHAVAGGWIRAVEPTEADAPYLAAVCDAFSPPHMSTLAREAIAPIPTVELTVHFRRGDARAWVADSSESTSRCS